MFFFFNDTATTEIYTLSLHDALPIAADDSPRASRAAGTREIHDAKANPLTTKATATATRARSVGTAVGAGRTIRDRKSTRLNSSHANISYAVFCLKKKKHSSLLSHPS